MRTLEYFLTNEYPYPAIFILITARRHLMLRKTFLFSFKGMHPLKAISRCFLQLPSTLTSLNDSKNESEIFAIVLWPIYKILSELEQWVKSYWGTKIVKLKLRYFTSFGQFWLWSIELKYILWTTELKFGQLWLIQLKYILNMCNVKYLWCKFCTTII